MSNGTSLPMFGDRLRAIREHWGLTQLAMGDRMGLSVKAYQNAEYGGTNPGFAAIAPLASLGLNLNWLATGEGEMLIGSTRPEPIRYSSRAENAATFSRLLQDWLADLVERGGFK